MRKILVVEDESAIRELVVLNLRMQGNEVHEAESAEAALALFRQEKSEFDCAVLDIMLPGMDGLELCRIIRDEAAGMGIIMLSAKSMEMDKIKALSVAGADDYVTKPFSVSELIARIEAVCRRAQGTAGQQPGEEKTLESGVFSLDLRSRLFYKSGEQIALTQTEFQFMEYLLRRSGESLSRMDILQGVWGEGYYGEAKIVDVNIRRLRMKIEDDPNEPKHLLTDWGRGYRWVQ